MATTAVTVTVTINEDAAFDDIFGGTAVPLSERLLWAADEEKSHVARHENALEAGIHLSYLQCGLQFLENASLRPDQLHPTAADNVRKRLATAAKGPTRFLEALRYSLVDWPTVPEGEDLVSPSLIRVTLGTNLLSLICTSSKSRRTTEKLSFHG
jgi:hypothetical protein